MLYNPHCVPHFSPNYMLASQLQKMFFVTPIASYLSLVRDTNKHPDPSMSRPVFRHMPRFPACGMHGCCDWSMSRKKVPHSVPHFLFKPLQTTILQKE